jgi:hypothetical protein
LPDTFDCSPGTGNTSSGLAFHVQDGIGNYWWRSNSWDATCCRENRFTIAAGLTTIDRKPGAVDEATTIGYPGQ